MSNQYERLYERALEGELNRWGNWIEKHSDFSGYPGINIIESFIGGGGGGIKGHRILCLEMPTEVYATHGRVLRLEEMEREAIWLRYVTRVKEDGTLWTIRERCALAKITLEEFSKRLERAKEKILGIYRERDCVEKVCQVPSVAS